MFLLEQMLTILKGLEIFSSPTMHAKYSSLLVLNSYWITSEIESDVNNLDDRSSAPSSVIFGV